MIQGFSGGSVNPPAIKETQVLSLGWEDLLGKEMATHSSTLAWKTPWTKEPSRLQSMGQQRVDMPERLHFHFSWQKPTQNCKHYKAIFLQFTN